MHKRGIRILPGGDYGFAWIPHGTNATDLEYFVKYLGFTPMEKQRWVPINLSERLRRHTVAH